MLPIEVLSFLPATVWTHFKNKNKPPGAGGERVLSTRCNAHCTGAVIITTNTPHTHTHIGRTYILAFYYTNYMAKRMEMKNSREKHVTQIPLWGTLDQVCNGIFPAKYNITAVLVYDFI